MYRLVLLLLLAAPATAFAQAVLDSDAARHVGETVTLDCAVVSVHTSKSGTTFLNCGADYPNQNAQLVVFQSAASRVGSVEQYRGKHITVRGLLKSYKGKPEIVLESATQIEGSR